jgi:signal transduction histidine kinase
MGGRLRLGMGGRLHVGMVAAFASEWMAGFARNPQQGALIAVIGALSGVKLEGIGRNSRTLLDHGKALAEDALAVAYGTFTTLAREAGKETAFIAEEIDAPDELKRLCERLKMTNARDDLQFAYKSEAGFPVLKMDRNAFTSVMFSLIHNAMKYADSHTRVTLECSFERRTGEAALKVKSSGEPIDPDERETIFEKFKRGRRVEHGRRHSGVGLGLWVARELMRAHGGDLSVELSAADPRFSVFIVHIPQAAS